MPENIGELRYSVVVPAYNAAADLGSCLEAILSSMPEGGEVLVADDGSCDRTLAIARRFPVRVFSTERNSGPAAARNLAASHARGDILLFFDADVEVTPITAAALLQTLEEHPEYDGVMGSYDDAPLHPQLVSRFRNLLHHFTHQQARRHAVTFWTGCGALRKSAFLRVGGFDESLQTLEDVDLGLRVTQSGGRIQLEPGIWVKHRKRWTLTSMVRTDVLGRAVPWVRAIEPRAGVLNDLNTRWTDRASAVLICVAVLLALFGRWHFVLPLAGAAWVSRAWHLFLARRYGVVFCLSAMPLHWLYLFYSSVTYGVMRLLPRRAPSGDAGPGGVHVNHV